MWLLCPVWTNLCREQICSWPPSYYRPPPWLKLVSSLQQKHCGEFWPALGAVTSSAGGPPGRGFGSWLPGASGLPSPWSETTTNQPKRHDQKHGFPMANSARPIHPLRRLKSPPSLLPVYVPGPAGTGTPLSGQLVPEQLVFGELWSPVEMFALYSLQLYLHSSEPE